MCLKHRTPGDLYPEKQKITDKEVANFIFPEGLSKIFCFRKDEKGDVVEYACLDSNLKKVVVMTNLDEEQYDIYYWDHSHKNFAKMVNFLSSLSSRESYLKGKPYEKKIAEESWQVYSPQSITPLKLKERIFNIDQNI